MMLGLLSLASCSDDDSPILDFSRTELPKLNSLGQNVMYVYNNQNTKYVFTWSQARFFFKDAYASTSIGGYEKGGITYELQCDTVGNNFATPISAGSVTSLNSLTIDAAELAKTIEATYPQPDSIAPLEFRIKAQFGSTDTTIIYSSNALPVTLNYAGKPADPVPDHAPYKVYVDDQTGWDATTLYIWNDGGKVKDGWPGVAPTSTEKIGNTTYKVWELDEAYQKAKGMHFIFNNNGGGTQIDDVLSGFEFTGNVYLRLNADKTFQQLPDPFAKTIRLYVKNTTGWADTYLYMWGNGADVADPWPGIRLDGGNKVTLDGVDYTEYYLPQAYVGKTGANFIFNNNAGSQFDGPQNVNLDHDFGLTLTGTSATEEKLPARIFVLDDSGWGDLSLYAWNETGNMLGWPGVHYSFKENINGLEWKVFVMPSDYAAYAVNYIFNNNGGGSQFDAMSGYTIKDETFVSITSKSYTVIE